MKKLFTVVFIGIVLSSLVFSACNCKKESCGDTCCAATVQADSLAALWNNAWNTKDIEALKKMIADDALVIDKDFVIEGRDSIMSKWISQNLPVVSNVTTQKLKENNCGCCVALTGFYTLDVKSADSVIPYKGNFTFIWNQDKDKSYKLKVMHMHQF